MVHYYKIFSRFVMTLFATSVLALSWWNFLFFVAMIDLWFLSSWPMVLNRYMSWYVSRWIKTVSRYLFACYCNAIILWKIDEHGFWVETALTNHSFGTLAVWDPARVWLLSGKIFPINPTFISCNFIIQSPLVLYKIVDFFTGPN